MSETNGQTKCFQCRHIRVSGERCGSPSLKHEDFCFYHHTTRRPVPVEEVQARRGRRATFDLPLPEDRSAVQLAIGIVLRRIANHGIDPRRAGLLLYGLQIASLNLPRQTSVPGTGQADGIVVELVQHPTHGEIAHVAELTEAKEERSLAGRLLDELDALDALDQLDAPSPHPAAETAIIPGVEGVASLGNPPPRPQTIAQTVPRSRTVTPPAPGRRRPRPSDALSFAQAEHRLPPDPPAAVRAGCLAGDPSSAGRDPGANQRAQAVDPPPAHPGSDRNQPRNHPPDPPAPGPGSPLRRPHRAARRHHPAPPPHLDPRRHEQPSARRRPDPLPRPHRLHPRPTRPQPGQPLGLRQGHRIRSRRGRPHRPPARHHRVVESHALGRTQPAHRLERARPLHHLRPRRRPLDPGTLHHRRRRQPSRRVEAHAHLPPPVHAQDQTRASHPQHLRPRAVRVPPQPRQPLPQPSRPGMDRLHQDRHGRHLRRHPASPPRLERDRRPPRQRHVQHPRDRRPLHQAREDLRPTQTHRQPPPHLPRRLHRDHRHRRLLERRPRPHHLLLPLRRRGLRRPPYHRRSLDARPTHREPRRHPHPRHRPPGRRPRNLPRPATSRTETRHPRLRPRPEHRRMAKHHRPWTPRSHPPPHPGELLNPDGTVSQTSSGGPMWWSYTLAGSPQPETWHPRFSLYGFRFLQTEWVTPHPERASILNVEGIAVHTTAPITGAFESSNVLLNRIHHLIVQAMHNNSLSLFTDCPHREKLGWLEETHLVAPGLLFNTGLERLFAATAHNIRDAQLPTGLVPTTAPKYTVFGEGGVYNAFDDSPEWGSASILAPWAAFRFSGDRAELERGYSAMQRFLAFLTGRAGPDGIVAYGLGDWYDIGPGDPGISKQTTPGVTATLMLFEDASTMASIAAILNHPEDAASFQALATRTGAAFNRRFFHPETGLYDRGSQTANAMPLALGIVPPDRRATILDHIVADIHAHRDHVTTGEIGYPYLLRALMQAGRDDVILAMLLRTDPPSYGSQLAAGATALTEAWDANPADSQDHFMLGAAEEWFYRGLAGIDLDLARPAPARITIRPAPIAGVDWVRCGFDSPVGHVQSNWRRDTGGLHFDITIPPGTEATVILPATPAAQITESSSAAEATPGVVLIERTAARATYRVRPGTYHFNVGP